MQTPAGFDIEQVEEIPTEILFAKQMSRWLWLRDAITSLETGKVLRVLCPSKNEARLAYASVRNEHTYRRIPGHSLICRKAPKDGGLEDGPWYLYIQKDVKNKS